jgi:hypothetical protein
VFSLRTHAIISGALFVFMILIAVAGNALISSGTVKDLGPFQTPARILFFAIFAAFGLSLIPLMVKLVIGAQLRAGNANVGMIRVLADHQVAIVWTFWILILLGLAVALPAAIREGFISDSSPAPATGTLANVPSRGTLIAAPGMTVDDVVKRSTLELDRGITTIAGGAIFDFKIPGTAIELNGCRYYFMSTYTHDPARIESINIGTSPKKLTRAELTAADADLRSRLKADAWLTGHEEYRTQEDQQLHGGKTRGDEGRIWLKDEIILDIESRRMDDPVAGEDAGTAGQWIQYIDLRLRKDYPWIERYVFAPAQE